MILLLFGFALLIFIIGFCVMITWDETSVMLSIVIFLFSAIGLACIAGYVNNTPTALDVYQGKTELRITYEGKIPVDSVVIYKKGGSYD